MKASELATLLTEMIKQHGDVEVHAFPGWDTSFPVEPETVDYYSEEISKPDAPHILITGKVPEGAY